MIDWVIAAMCLVLGAALTWRALVNANSMDHRSSHRIRTLNIALLLAGITVFLSPFGSNVKVMLIALQAALAVFVICMFIGRRPTDRVLSKQ